MVNKDKNTYFFKDVYMELLEKDFKNERIGVSSYKSRLKVINQLIKENVFTKTINEIDINLLQDYFNSFANTHSISTYNSYFNIINNVFIYAVENKYINKNIMDNIIRFKSKKTTESICLSLNDQKKLTNYFLSSSLNEEKYKHIFLLQLYTGILSCEVVALDINDVDLQNLNIYIHQYLTMDKDGKQKIVNYNEDDPRNRTIFFPPFLVESLKELIDNYHNFNRSEKAQKIYNELSEEYKCKLFLKVCILNRIYDQAKDNPLIDYDIALLNIKKLPEKLELEQKKLNFLIFKSTYITRLIEGDIPLYIIQKLIGIQHIHGMYMLYNKLPISKVVKKNDDLSEEYLKSLNIL